MALSAVEDARSSSSERPKASKFAFRLKRSVRSAMFIDHWQVRLMDDGNGGDVRIHCIVLEPKPEASHPDNHEFAPPPELASIWTPSGRHMDAMSRPPNKLPRAESTSSGHITPLDRRAG